ncbi:MAG: hypothetical protein KAU22_12620 [Desulfuromonadales bacterium]|nr:hypothetical protein [Desulfuromonadales bacterium]
MKFIVIICTQLFLCTLLVTTSIATAESPQINRDMELIQALGCQGCHIIAGEGGTLAANLDHISTRLTANQIKHQLTTGTTSTSGFMPNYSSLSASEQQQIGAYLYEHH